MRSFAFVACAAIGLGGVIGGCEIVTGGTDGYAAAVDAGGGTAFQCTTAGNCAAGDSGGPICCLSVNASTSAAETTCTTTCQGGIQLCSTNADCAGVGCVVQACESVSPIPFAACGLLPLCSAVDASAPVDAATTLDASTLFDAGMPDVGTPDAGTPDAGTPDAGTPDVQALDAG